METIRCTVEGLTYYNKDNDYAVVRAKSEPHGTSFVAVGTFAAFRPGVRLEIDGEFKVDPRYGSRFVASAWREIMPDNIKGIERFLGSGYIKGIGRATAKAIVKHFGKETAYVLENEMERLDEVPGLGKKRLQQVTEGWREHRAVRDIFIGLQAYGVSSAFASRIFRMYGSDALKAVRDNPYRLADEIDGIGFRTADDIASGMGYGKDDPRRVEAGVLFLLGRFADDGHVFAVEEDLIRDSASMLDVDDGAVLQAIVSLHRRKKVVVEDHAVYLPVYHYAEAGAARCLGEIIATPCAKTKVSSPERTPEGMVYDSAQLEAIERAVDSKAIVLTGGPGTGKTTTVKGIISAFKARKMKILLAAPTGRAAKRMSEATGMEAKTIHRLLEYSPAGGFGRDQENPLEGDVLIVDESSMIDILLLYSLVKAVPPHMRLIFVGDIDQLPSVGAGNVLRDIISSGVIPVVRLTHIFRQAKSSRIITNAHAVNAGRDPDISNGLDTDFFFVRAADDKIADTIVSLVSSRLPGTYDIDPKEIQVLTPMYKGDAGASALNLRLQQVLNPDGVAMRKGDTIMRAGDKVMQIKNNYDKNIFNGDIGYIESVSVPKDEAKLTVRFDSRRVEYSSDDLDELMPAYAITIHKSQGSEFPIIVVPVSMSHYVMLQRNLIYTAITRARRICVLVGDPRALSYAVRNQRISIRNSRLAERLAR